MRRRPSQNPTPNVPAHGNDALQSALRRQTHASRLGAIGIKAFLHVPKKKMKKLDPRNFEGIMVGYGGSHQYRPWNNKFWVCRDVRFMGEGTSNIVQVGTVGARNDMGPHGDAAPLGNAISYGDAVPHDNGNKARIIYDTIDVLPPPRNEPVSEFESDSEESGESNSDAGNELDIHIDHGTTREPTIETEAFSPALSSPKDSDPEIRTQHVRSQNLCPSIQDHISLPKTKKAQLQSHISYAYKTNTMMWSEFAEPQNYQDAINDPIYDK